MFSLYTAQSIISTITILLAYLICVTIAGYFRAWVATKMGDDTAQSLGFLTLNPLMHIDFFGVIMLLFFKFGWGKFVPINPLNFHGRFATLKLIAAFLSDTFAHIVMATVGATLLIFIFGQQLFLIEASSLEGFTNISSATLVVSKIIGSAVFLNIMLAVVSFILSVCGLCVMFYMSRNPEYNHYSEIIMIVVPVLLLFLFATPLFQVVYLLITIMGYFLATLFHVN